MDPASGLHLQNVIRNYGKMLVELAAVVPDGIVCFFVSYRYMDAIVSKWNDMGVLNVRLTVAAVLRLSMWRRICVILNSKHRHTPGFHALCCTDALERAPDNPGIAPQELMQHKLVFIETTDVLETTLALDNFRRACDCGRGAAFFSVARGKVRLVLRTLHCRVSKGLTSEVSLKLYSISMPCTRFALAMQRCQQLVVVSGVHCTQVL
jgi:Helicase C-terminal domain